MSTFPDEPTQLEQLADETFSSTEAANAWLNRPHPSLDGLTPLEAARTSAGAQRAVNLLLATQGR